VGTRTSRLFVPDSNVCQVGCHSGGCVFNAGVKAGRLCTGKEVSGGRGDTGGAVFARSMCGFSMCINRVVVCGRSVKSALCVFVMDGDK